MRNLSLFHVILASMALSLAPSGCGLILGLGDFTDGTGGGGDSGTLCQPGEVVKCEPYTGTPGTEDIGNCKASEKTCSMDGSMYGACSVQVTPLPENCKVKGDEDCDGIACSDAILSGLYGDGTDQMSTSIAVDSMGNVLVVGTFKGKLSLDKDHSVSSGGGSDFYLAKFDPMGTPLWISSFGDAMDNGNAIAVAVNKADEIIITGGLRGSVDFGGGPLKNGGGEDIFIAKFAPQGTYQWAQSFGDAMDQRANSVATDSQGNIIISGEYQGTFNALAPATGIDMFVMKLMPSGTGLWTERFGDKVGQAGNYQIGVASTIDSTDNIIITGLFGTSVTFGATSLADHGGGDIFIVKLDPSGSPVPGFVQQIGGTGLDASTAVAVDSKGQIRLTGYFQNTLDLGGGNSLTSQGLYDGFIAAFDATGNYQWGQRFGSATDNNGTPDSGTGIAVDKDDNVILTGVTYGDTNLGGTGDALKSAGGADIILAKFDKQGTHLWSKLFGDLNNQTSSGLAVDRANKGEILLTGSVQGSIDLGTGKLTSMGELDALVARFYP